MSFYDTKITKSARKQHFCDYCDEIINEGETFVREAGMNLDEEFVHAKLHLECNAASKAVAEINEGEWEMHEYARGRVDDDRSRPPQFKPDGTRTEEPL